MPDPALPHRRWWQIGAALLQQRRQMWGKVPAWPRPNDEALLERHKAPAH